jgi:hypothetical protein
MVDQTGNMHLVLGQNYEVRSSKTERMVQFWGLGQY